MHSPEVIIAMLLGTFGVPLAALFLLTYLISLAFARTRAFAARLIGLSTLIAIGATIAFWCWAQLGLPAPYHYQAAISTIPFWFGACGFTLFARNLRATRNTKIQIDTQPQS